MRKCNICKTEKELSTDNFSVDRSRPDGFSYTCKPCYNERTRKNYDSEKEKLRHKLKYKNNIKKDPDFVQRTNLKKRYNLSLEKFNLLFEQQGYACKICKTTIRPAKGWTVDHNHKCCPDNDKTCGNCVRGILCQDCNHGLGRFKDESKFLLEAIKYLEEYNV